MAKKIIIPFLSVLPLAIVPCNDEETLFPKPQPAPEPYSEHTCLKAGDIYKIFPDTIFFHKKGTYAKIDGSLQQLHYEDGSSFALMTCKGKSQDLNNASNSPLSWMIVAVEQEKRDTVYGTQGTIKINQLLVPKDVDRILKLEDGKKIEYGVSLLNFDQDTIQSGTVTVKYKKDLQP